jgi:hypothetical protein
MLTFAAKYGSNIYSQFGEDGIINQCLTRMNKLHGTCIEFGGHDGYFCSNTRRLAECGWNYLMYDINPGGLDVQKKEITPDNVNELPPCDLISMDTDGHDYDLWKAYKGKPDIVIIEINSSLPPMVHHSSHEKGASYISMVRLAIEKGYFVLCHTGNVIAVLNKHRKLFPEVVGDGIDNYQDYFNTSHQ